MHRYHKLAKRKAKSKGLVLLLPVERDASGAPGNPLSK